MEQYNSSTTGFYNFLKQFIYYYLHKYVLLDSEKLKGINYLETTELLLKALAIPIETFLPTQVKSLRSIAVFLKGKEESMIAPIMF